MFSAILATAAAPQNRQHIEAPNFAPLNQWEAAVLSGDAAALQGLYSVSPPSTTVTPGGESHDPAAEPNFWSVVHAGGLEGLHTQIVRMDSPQPGIQRVIFRVVLTMRTRSGEDSRFASVAQYWHEQDGKWIIVATQRTNIGRLPQPIQGKPNLYPDPSVARKDISRALATAALTHKRVLLVFGGNWCYDCHVLDDAFHYPEIARILDPNYVVVHVNIGQYDKNLDLAAKYQIPLKKGVPSLAVLDSHGNLLVSQKQGDFENTTRIGLKDVESFLERWEPAHGG
jgi:Thioredoxin-like